MPLLYRNTKTGELANVRDPNEIDVQTENAAQAKRHSQRIVTQLDASKKWQRAGSAAGHQGLTLEEEPPADPPSDPDAGDAEGAEQPPKSPLTKGSSAAGSRSANRSGTARRPSSASSGTE